MTALINEYLSAIDREVKIGNTTEHSHRSALKTLIEAVRPDLAAVNEPKRVECGAPDFDVRLVTEKVNIGYLETKDIGISLDQAEKSEQLLRYRHSLENLILTNYFEFRWYIDGDLKNEVQIARLGRNEKLIRNIDGIDIFLRLLEDFLTYAPQPIKAPIELATRMARLTYMIRDIVIQSIQSNKASQFILNWRSAFTDVLIADLDHPEKTEEFADMFAQTLAYGLFSARVMDITPGFSRHEAQNLIPKTNPFLRKFFYQITGPDLDDEPYVGFVENLVQLLNLSDMQAILSEFGKRKRQEDPIVHFYETFLATYDPSLREIRGIYYTPQPVVSFIVRSVNNVLKEHFNIRQGLAATETVEFEYKGEEQQEETIKSTSPKVLILDPACGTGTFLYHVVDFIRNKFMEEGNAGLWSGYVKNQLLPRLFGFELLMAPYAVAHMKLGMQLAGKDLSNKDRSDWTFDFEGDERLGIYLTNTLEAAEKKVEGLFGPLQLVAEEAMAANHVKRNLPVLIVIGNPPYSGHSANQSWREEKVTKGGQYFNDWKIASGVRAVPTYLSASQELTARQPTFIGNLIRDYYICDGDWLGERNPRWLQDDYVKFIRWGQWRIERTGAGILAFITNHGYLDNPTFRGMRQQLMRTFTHIYIIDLHGNVKKKEKAPDGSLDKNVFDIQQGVAISIFIKDPSNENTIKVYHQDLWGKRDEKYTWLRQQDLSDIDWTEIKPQSPFYLFIPQDTILLEEYEKGWSISDIFTYKSIGIVTARDGFTIGWSEDDIWGRVEDFVSLPVEKAREKYNLRKDVRDWKVHWAQKDVRESGPAKDKVVPIYYRPYDIRYTYYTGKSRGFLCMPRHTVMQHLLRGDNLALITSRLTKGEDFKHVQVSMNPVEAICMSPNTSNNGYVFPLYLFTIEGKGGQGGFHTSEWEPDELGRVPNFNPKFVRQIEEELGLQFKPKGSGDLEETIDPLQVFGYIYAILHSTSYRSRFVDFLRHDFPKIPITKDKRLFKSLCELGIALKSVQINEDIEVNNHITSYPVSGDNKVMSGYPKHLSAGSADSTTGEVLESDRVYINPKQYFENVPTDVWGFHVGGYQVCNKWLKVRKGHKLSYDDLIHFQDIIVVIKETMNLMEQIDNQIVDWPLV